MEVEIGREIILLTGMSGRVLGFWEGGPGRSADGKGMANQRKGGKHTATPIVGSGGSVGRVVSDLRRFVGLDSFATHLCKSLSVCFLKKVCMQVLV